MNRTTQSALSMAEPRPLPSNVSLGITNAHVSQYRSCSAIRRDDLSKISFSEMPKRFLYSTTATAPHAQTAKRAPRPTSSHRAERLKMPRVGASRALGSSGATSALISE